MEIGLRFLRICPRSKFLLSAAATVRSLAIPQFPCLPIRQKRRSKMPVPDGYLSQLSRRVGQGWTYFWFTPSDPFTLSVLRVLTAAVALALYLSYLPDLEIWFGPDGLLSENAMLRLRGAVPLFSMFDY